MAVSNSEGVCRTSAMRTSPARTQHGYGSEVGDSDVVSVTQNLRIAYPFTECNIPTPSGGE